MRFLRRSLVGLFLMAVTLALLGVAGSMVYDAVRAQMDEDPRNRPARERVLTVNAVPVSVTNITPQLTVFGELRAIRTLDVRPSTGGKVVEVSANFLDGGAVTAGVVLLRIDPTDAQTALARLRADHSAAHAQ